MKETITITGAGIAGLAIARSLEKKGYQPVIYEAAPELKPVGAGIVLAFNAMRAGTKLGLRDQLLRHGQSMGKAMIIDHQGRSLSQIDYFKKTDLFGDVSLAIHRADLQNILRNALRHTSIHLNKKVKAVIPHEHETEIEFEDGTTTRTGYLIAADGIHSVIRTTLLPASQPRYAGYTCWRGIGTLPGTYPFKDTVVEGWGAGVRLGIVPLQDGGVYWFAVKNAMQNDLEMKNAGKEDILRFLEGWNREMLKVIEDTPSASIIWGDISDIAPLRQFAFGNILLTGDAAHATTPNIGQGGCQALEDAAVLLDCLDPQVPLEKIFKAFEARRIKRTKRVIETSRRIGRIGQMEGWWQTRLRNALTKSIPPGMSLKQIMWLNDTAF